MNIIKQNNKNYFINKNNKYYGIFSSPKLIYDGYDHCNSRVNRAKFCIYTNGDIICCTQASSYNYQSQFDISKDRGKTWTTVTTVAGNDISSGGDPSGLMLGFNSQKTPIYGFSRDHNWGACQFVTENLQTELSNISGGSGSWMQDMTWIWNEKIPSKGNFYFGNDDNITHVNLDNFTGTNTTYRRKPFCRYADVEIPVYYLYYNSNIYSSSDPAINFTLSDISLPNGDSNFITLQSFKGYLLAIYKTEIYIYKDNKWVQCRINGIDLNVKNINPDWLSGYHTNQVFSAALKISGRCEFIYTFDGENYYYMDCTENLSQTIRGNITVTAGIDNANYVDFAVMSENENFIIHTKKANKEIFSNILDYDKTILLCHFDNNVNFLGYGKNDFNLTDGSYQYSTDSKFGSKSVSNYHWSMTFYSSKAYQQGIDLGCYDKTLEVWFKPIVENYQCELGLSNGNWSDRRYIRLSSTGNKFVGTNSPDVPFIAKDFKYNEWNHVALTYAKVDNQLEIKLWINGNFCASATYPLMSFVERFAFLCHNGTDGGTTNTVLADEVVFHNYIRYNRSFELQTQAYNIE